MPKESRHSEEDVGRDPHPTSSGSSRVTQGSRREIQQELLQPRREATGTTISISISAVDEVALDLRVLLTPTRRRLSLGPAPEGEVEGTPPSKKTRKVSQGIMETTTAAAVQTRPLLSPARLNYNSSRSSLGGSLPNGSLPPVVEAEMSEETTNGGRDDSSLPVSPASTARCSPVPYPSTPELKPLGYDYDDTQFRDGLLNFFGVYTMERSSPRTGEARSPWVIKKVRPDLPESLRELAVSLILAEAETLRKLVHPNIIEFRGIRPQGGFAMEQAPTSLWDLVQARSRGCSVEDPRSFSPSRILRVAKHIAKALKYLHEEAKPTFIHGNIQSSHILVFGDFQKMKLGSFGRVLEIGEDGSAAKGKEYESAGVWSPPEGNFLQPITAKSDIYPYGLALYQMLTLRPYSLRPPLGPHDYGAALGPSYTLATKLMDDCNEFNPLKRPSAQEILSLLQKNKSEKIS